VTVVARTEQVKMTGAEMAAVGGVVLLVMVTEATAEQPLAAVPVTVYVPALVTTLLDVAIPLLQLKLVALLLAVNVIAVLAQVSVDAPEIVMVGLTKLLLTVADDVAVQALASLTVTVYAPAAIAFRLALVPPLLQE
jgi:hypothetical protein